MADWLVPKVAQKPHRLAQPAPVLGLPAMKLTFKWLLANLRSYTDKRYAWVFGAA